MSAAQPPRSDTPLLSIVVTVTTGEHHVDRCLEALEAQRDAPAFEVLVPFDRSLPDVARWRERFPWVRFIDLSRSADSDGADHDEPEDRAAGDPGRRHLAYDQRRAAGLAAGRGAILVLTEDHGRPAPDWCARIAEAHAALPHAAIGGAIDNQSDLPLTWAVYFSDFGRYQSPLPEGPAEYVSDVNVSYKRGPLEAVRSAWEGAYHETAVHGALRASGETLWRCPRIVVHQERGRLRLGPCLRERFAWGRLYAGKRAHEVAVGRRVLLALSAPLLPPLLLWRHARNTFARGRNTAAFLRAAPVLGLLLLAWSAGEAVGIWTGRPIGGASPSNDAAESTKLARETRE